MDKWGGADAADKEGDRGGDGGRRGREQRRCPRGAAEGKRRGDMREGRRRRERKGAAALVQEGGGGGRARGLKAKGERSEQQGSGVGWSEQGDGMRETGGIRVCTAHNIVRPMTIRRSIDLVRRGMTRLDA